MKFDTIVAGGGLSAMVAAITIQKAGRKTLVVTSGQSALHFFSGSLELLHCDGDMREAMETLPAEHPYSKLGAEKVLALAGKAPEFFTELGYTVSGSCNENHTRRTSLGMEKQCWLTFEQKKSAKGDEFPMSSLGIALQVSLRKCFEKLGGTVLSGDTVTGGEISDGKLQYICTANHGPGRFEADSFIIATGSFFSGGLYATQEKVTEPALGLDVDYAGSREEWFAKDTFDAQPYMKFGIHTDSCFHPSKDGAVLSNVYVTGSALSGTDSIKEGCGGGVAFVTAMNAAEKIIGQ